jgi:hypothetical protein
MFIYASLSSNAKSQIRGDKINKTGFFILLLTALFIIPAIPLAKLVQTAGPNGATLTCLTTMGTKIFAGTNGNGVFVSINNGRSWRLPSMALAHDITDKLDQLEKDSMCN